MRSSMIGHELQVLLAISDNISCALLLCHGYSVYCQRSDLSLFCFSNITVHSANLSNFARKTKLTSATQSSLLVLRRTFIGDDFFVLCGVANMRKLINFRPWLVIVVGAVLVSANHAVTEGNFCWW